MNNYSAVCYVLLAFPKPSETFIAEEILSVHEAGVRPFVISFTNGDHTVIHASAKKILEENAVNYVKALGQWEKIRIFLGALCIRPMRTLSWIRSMLRAGMYRWVYWQALEFSNRLITLRVRHIHAHFADVNFIYAAALADLTGISYGVTTHRFDIFEPAIPPSMTRRLCARANSVITISEANRHEMAKRFGTSTEKVSIVHCGIRTEYFSPAEGRQATCPVTLRLLCIASLDYRKGHDILLRALDVVAKRGIAFEMLFAGYGEEHERLESLATELGIADRVRFLGAQTQDQVRQLLREVDVHVLASRSEGLPVVCMEALASGVPVIAPNLPGMSELVRDHETGRLFPPEDYFALSDVLVSVAQDDDSRVRMGKTGRRLVEEEFTRSKCTATLIKLWALGKYNGS